MIETFLWFVGGVAVGWFGRIWYMSLLMIAYMKHTREAYDELNRNVVTLIVEQDKDTFFVYDGKTSAFLLQGTDPKVIATELQAMFPGKRLVVLR